MSIETETSRYALATRLVQNEVVYCVSSLINGLQRATSDMDNDKLQTLGVDYDDLIKLSHREPGVDEYREADDLFVSVKGKRLQAYDVESGDDGFRWTELEPLIMEGEPAEKGEWCETELEAWEALFDDQGLDRPDGSEVYEHWIVTDYLAARLIDAGETVVRDVAGLTVWGRCTTGQAISMDYVIQQIAADMYGDAPAVVIEGEA